MVDASERQSEPVSPPFALRSTLYTIGFLLFILGIVPSVFYFLGEVSLGRGTAVESIRQFWLVFRILVGSAIFAIGLAAYLYCSIWLIYFGKGPHVEFDPPKVFVATGPYRWVRNPVVITLLVTVLGEAVCFGSLGIIVLLAVGLPLAHYQVTRVEEPRLAKRFGGSYEEYCKRVPRWIPRPPRD